ncbi:MAG: AAA family ATPase [Pseudomonadaceae bacterium]|nr:AAA family ATPase [Pseudomonadaceae bacterium]
MSEVSQVQDGLDIVCLADVKPEPVVWLWPQRIALGKLTVIVGNPGLGKSQLVASIAGVVTTGATWPDGTASCDVGDVILLSAEDDAADTLVPRLHAVHADMQRCHTIEAVNECGKDGRSIKRDFNIRNDIERLERCLKDRPETRLIVIDPISSYMGMTDGNNNNEVRSTLAPLIELAARHCIAVIAVTHMNKSLGTNPMARVMGSMGLIAAARAGWLVVEDKNDLSRRLFLSMKSNLSGSAENQGLAFRIKSAVVQENISTSRIVWDGTPVTISATDALQQEDGNDEAGDVQGFLHNLLEDGPQKAVDIFTAAKAAGFSEKSIRLAKKKLGIKTRKSSMHGGWEWGLPSKIPEGGEDTPSK